MTVEKLIEALRTVPQDLEVVTTDEFQGDEFQIACEVSGIAIITIEACQDDSLRWCEVPRQSDCHTTDPSTAKPVVVFRHPWDKDM